MDRNRLQEYPGYYGKKMKLKHMDERMKHIDERQNNENEMSRGHVPSLEPIEHDYGLMDQHRILGTGQCHVMSKTLSVT